MPDKTCANCVNREGFIANNLECQPCDPDCLTCSGTAKNNCLTCRVNYILHTNKVCLDKSIVPLSVVSTVYIKRKKFVDINFDRQVKEGSSTGDIFEIQLISSGGAVVSEFKVRKVSLVNEFKTLRISMQIPEGIEGATLKLTKTKPDVKNQSFGILTARDNIYLGFFEDIKVENIENKVDNSEK
jgi:hypothetical protein